MVLPLSIPMMSNPLFVQTAPTNSIPQPTMAPKSNNDPSSHVLRDHGYTMKRLLKFQDLIIILIIIVFLLKLKKLLRTRNMKKRLDKWRVWNIVQQIWKDWEVIKVSHSMIFECFSTFIYPSILKHQSLRNMIDMEIM